MSRLIKLILAWAVLLLLAISCGGGGGDETPTPPPPPAPNALSKVAGDGQTAAPGAKVAVAPEVVVVDSAGAPMADTEVAFAVTAGGGSVQVTSARTDAAGHASCGAWTLGSAKGLNTLRASVAGLVPMTFSAKAANTSADVSVSVLAPSPGQTVGEAMTVAATVKSTYMLATVTASFNGKSVQLTYGPYYGPPSWTNVENNAWRGVLSLAGQPRGDVVFVVTADDVFGHSTDVIVPVVLDRAPAVSVSAPFEGFVARPNANIVATCTGDDPAGCVSLTATVNEKVVASGKGSISQAVDFSAYEGQSISLAITGFDAIGQRATVTRNIFVESSAHLSVRAEVTGPVWDVSNTRVLFVDVSGAPAALKVLDTATGKLQTVEEAAELAGGRTGYGFLTQTGAIYVRGKADEPGYSWVYEWRAGSVAELGKIAVFTSNLDYRWSRVLRVAGNWAVFASDIQRLWRRDLGIGQSTLVAEPVFTEYDVSSNGDVAYQLKDEFGRSIYRWRNGTALALTKDQPYDNPVNGHPVTDGVNVVYVREQSPPVYRIAAHDGSAETVLSTITLGMNVPRPDSGYAVAGGFVAYCVEDGVKALQIWRHSPAGEQQLTLFGSSSTIDAIGPDGTVLLTHAQKRYRAVPGAALQEIGSSLGRVIFRDGKFLVLLDRTVLEVGP